MSVFHPFGRLSAILIKFEIVVCNLFQFGKSLKFVIWEKVNSACISSLIFSNQYYHRRNYRRIWGPVTHHNSANSVPTSNLVRIKEVVIRTTVFIAGIIYYTCNLVLIFNVPVTKCLQQTFLTYCFKITML